MQDNQNKETSTDEVQTENKKIHKQTRYEQNIFVFSKMFRPALGPNQPPLQWIPRHEVSHTPVRMSGDIPLLPLYALTSKPLSSDRLSKSRAFTDGS